MEILQLLVGIICLICYLFQLKSPNTLGEDAIVTDESKSQTILITSCKFSTILFQFYHCYWYVNHIELIEFDLTEIDVFSITSLIVGLVFTLVGMYLRIESKRQLGRFFTHSIGVSKEQKLVANGVYTYLMHPSYLGILLIALAASTVHRSVSLFVSFLANVVWLRNRMITEEDMLSLKYGVEFDNYKCKRSRIIPFIY